VAGLYCHSSVVALKVKGASVNTLMAGLRGEKSWTIYGSIGIGVAYGSLVVLETTLKRGGIGLDLVFLLSIGALIAYFVTTAREIDENVQKMRSNLKQEGENVY